MKAASFHDSGQDMEGWCQSLLDGLVQQVRTNVPRPLKTLLFYSVINPADGTPGERLAKIFAHILSGCVLATDSSHLAHPLVRTTLQCLCFVLSPDSYPLADAHPHPGDSHPHPLGSLHIMLRETAATQRDLSSLIDPSLLSADPSALALEELSECCSEEHYLAAQALVSREESLLALEAVHAALKQLGSGGQDPNFDPFKEYVNVALPGARDEAMLSQQKVMTLADSIDFARLLQEQLGSVGEKALQLIKTARWEWQVGRASQLTPEEKELVGVINKQLLPVE